METYTVKLGAGRDAVDVFVQGVSPEFLRRMVRKVGFRGYGMRDTASGGQDVTVFDAQMRYLELVVRGDGRIFRSCRNTGTMPVPWTLP